MSCDNVSALHGSWPMEMIDDLKKTWKEILQEKNNSHDHQATEEEHQPDRKRSWKRHSTVDYLDSDKSPLKSSQGRSHKSWALKIYVESSHFPWTKYQAWIRVITEYIDHRMRQDLLRMGTTWTWQRLSTATLSMDASLLPLIFLSFRESGRKTRSVTTMPWDSWT